jgi:hypothetical protein
MNNLNQFVFSNVRENVVSYKLSKEDVETLNDYLDSGNSVINFCLDNLIFREENKLETGTAICNFEGFISRNKEGECEVFIVNCKNLLNKISSFRV